MFVHIDCTYIHNIIILSGLWYGMTVEGFAVTFVCTQVCGNTRMFVFLRQSEGEGTT